MERNTPPTIEFVGGPIDGLRVRDRDGFAMFVCVPSPVAEVGFWRQWAERLRLCRRHTERTATYERCELASGGEYYRFLGCYQWDVPGTPLKPTARTASPVRS